MPAEFILCLMTFRLLAKLVVVLPRVELPAAIIASATTNTADFIVSMSF